MGSSNPASLHLRNLRDVRSHPTSFLQTHVSMHPVCGHLDFPKQFSKQPATSTVNMSKHDACRFYSLKRSNKCRIMSNPFWTIAHLAILFGCLNANSNMRPLVASAEKPICITLKLAKQWNHVKSKFCTGASGFLGGTSAYLISDLLHPNRVHLHRLLILFVLQRKYHFAVHHSYPDCFSYHMLHRSFGSSYWYLDDLVSEENCKSPVAAAAPKGITWQVSG